MGSHWLPDLLQVMEEEYGMATRGLGLELEGLHYLQR